MNGSTNGSTNGERKVGSVMPRAYAPDMTGVLVQAMEKVKEIVDRGEESAAIVHMEQEYMGQLAALYEFYEVEPAEWEGMKIWATPAMPDGTFYIEYKGEGCVFYLPILVDEAIRGIAPSPAPLPVFPDGWYQLLRPAGEWEGVPYNRDEFITPVVKERVSGGKGIRVLDFLLPPAPKGWMVRRVWVLTEEQKATVLWHVEQTLESIRTFGETGVPEEFLARLRETREALL